MDQAATQSETPGVLNTMADAMAELDRRAAARGEPAEAAEEEPETGVESSESQSADDSAEEVATDDEKKEAEPKDATPKTIEFGGKSYDLPEGTPESLAQGVEKLAKSIQADYTQKTQAVAEEKRLVDAAKQQTAAASSQLQQTQQALAFMAQNLIGSEPDIALAHQDPATFLVLQSQYKQRVDQFNALQQHGQALSQQQQEKQAQAQAEYRERESQALFKAMPDLAKAEKFSEFRAQALEAGNRYGFTANEIAAVSDHRMILALRDLAKFQRQEKQGGDLKTKLANTPPKVAKPGSASTQTPASARHQDAMRAFKKSGGSDRALREYLARTS